MYVAILVLCRWGKFYWQTTEKTLTAKCIELGEDTSALPYYTWLHFSEKKTDNNES